MSVISPQQISLELEIPFNRKKETLGKMWTRCFIFRIVFYKGNTIHILYIAYHFQWYLDQIYILNIMKKLKYMSLFQYMNTDLCMHKIYE